MKGWGNVTRHRYAFCLGLMCCIVVYPCIQSETFGGFTERVRCSSEQRYGHFDWTDQWQHDAIQLMMHWMFSRFLCLVFPLFRFMLAYVSLFRWLHQPRIEHKHKHKPNRNEWHREKSKRIFYCAIFIGFRLIFLLFDLSSIQTFAWWIFSLFSVMVYRLLAVDALGAVVAFTSV